MSWQSTVDILANCDSKLKWLWWKRLLFQLGNAGHQRVKAEWWCSWLRELDLLTSCKSAVFLQIVMSDSDGGKSCILPSCHTSWWFSWKPKRFVLAVSWCNLFHSLQYISQFPFMSGIQPKVCVMHFCYYQTHFQLLWLDRKWKVRFMVFMAESDCLQDVTLYSLIDMCQNFGRISASKFRVEE
jgi:hypothetical protein